MPSSSVVHKQVVEDRADGGTEAGQVVDYTDPSAVHLHPGDTVRQQHQEQEERDAWEDGERGNKRSSEIQFILEIQ